MRRREFITLVGGAAAAWPLAARAQQPAMPVIGYLSSMSPETRLDSSPAAFRKGLGEIGYLEGRNVSIEYRYARNENDRLPALAADLVRRRVAVIATFSAVPALAAKAATTTIPIVFGIPGDPVKLGLVASLNRPGGNVTGVSVLNGELAGKQLGLLHELLPGAARFAVLINPNSPDAESVIADLHAAASAIGRQIDVLYAGSSRDIDRAFASLVESRADALLISADPLFGNRKVQLATLAARHTVPAISGDPTLAEVGSLMTYGSSNADRFRTIGIYTGRILKGEKPADLPVLQSTKFELVINLQTARALGIEVPPALLAIADEVIE
jgi:putative ABC transport system substrate-binding protein